MEIIKTTKYDYSCLVIHHPEEGFLFLGRAQEGDSGSRVIYPAMHINSGECFDLDPSELLGSCIMDDMIIHFKKEPLKI